VQRDADGEQQSDHFASVEVQYGRISPYSARTS